MPSARTLLLIKHLLFCSYAFVVGSSNSYLTIATDPRVAAGKVALNAKQVLTLNPIVPAD